MKKTILTVSSAIALAAVAVASPITPEQALSRVQNAGGRAKVQSAQGRILVHTAKTDAGVASAYVFNNSNGGYLILSADDCAVPMLGYSDTGNIDPSDIPVQLQWLLSEYGRQMEYNAAHGLKAPSVYAPEGMNAIAPLVKTTWNQDAPYNNLCPTVNGVTAPTGCVATSFAQVMNYHQYPEKGKGSITYRDSSLKNRNFNFERVTFDWANMLDQYSKGQYDDAQATAVATLMKACGYGVEMNYGADASGAQSYKIVNAAVNFFSYDPCMKYYDRALFSTPQWTKMLYDNLVEYGPVIYDGYSFQGGHSFVCDGYDGHGYFHFNWGWGGVSNGYYILDTLNPESQGIGGAEGGFNYNQSGVFYIRKPNGSPAPADYDNLRLYGTAAVSQTGSKLAFSSTGAATLGWGNASYRPISVNVGAIITDAKTGAVVEKVQGALVSSNASGALQTVTLEAATKYPESISLEVELPATFADGLYKVTMATRQTGLVDGKECPWQPMVCNWGMANYCWLEVKGGKAVASTADAMRIKLEGAEITSPLYRNRNARLVTKALNPYDEPLTVVYQAKLFRNGAEQYTADYMMITLDAGIEKEVANTVSFFQLQNATAAGVGTYRLMIKNVNTGELIDTGADYEMTTISSGFTLDLDNLSVLDAPQENVTVGSRTFKNAYVADKAKGFEINFSYTVKKGYCDAGVRLVLSQYNPETNKFVSGLEDLYYGVPFLGEGQTEDLNLPMDFEGKDLKTVYQVRAGYFDGSGTTALGSAIYIAFTEGAGVEDIVADTSDEPARYFNLQGVEVTEPVSGQVLIKVQGGKTSKIKY